MSSLDIDEKGKKAWEDTSDFANYFCVYGTIYHQKQMLSDDIRMQGYYDSIFKNKAQFQGKVVLDVGTGSGILAIWAAQAGASKVYAVEATDIAVHARKLVKANGVENQVVVIQSKMEDVNLPEKVDIIISEWMGYFLLRESMLDSVLIARDKWLKPGGALYPSHAKMYLAPIQLESDLRQKFQDYSNAMDGWRHFTNSTKSKFGVDMHCLGKLYQQEQSEYYMQTANWVELHPDNVIGEAAIIKDIDIAKCTFEEIKGVDSPFRMEVHKNAGLCGFSGWFDVDFKGSPENPATNNVTLSTSPYIGYTHWGQQSFLLFPPPSTQVSDGDVIEGKVLMVRRKDNQRLMNVQITHTILSPESKPGSTTKTQTNSYQIE